MSHIQAQSQNVIVRLPQVIAKTGLSRSTIYKLVGENKFPPRVQLSTRTMGFLEAEVDQWLIDRVADRNNLIASRIVG